MKDFIRILIVDDIEKKSDIIRTKIKLFLPKVNIDFDTAGDYEQARDALLKQSYDFVVMDILIPAGGELPDARWSRVLLRSIVSGELGFPMHVFGLTEHEKETVSERIFFEKNTFGFHVFDWESDDWAISICSKIEYVINAVRNGASYRLNSFDYDLVILTARGEREYNPIQTVLFGDQESAGHPLWPSGAHFGEIRLRNGVGLKSALICVGKTGLSCAAVAATQAINVLRPKIIAMLGMAAGFPEKGVKLLDVIAARESACWQDGKSLVVGENEVFDLRTNYLTCSDKISTHIENELEFRNSAYNDILSQVKNTADYVLVKNKFQDLVADNPRLIFGLVVSGSEVVASKSRSEKVRHRHPTALGLEMEIHAVYTAVKMAIGAKPQFVALKGVADVANPEKDDDIQSLASIASAHAFLELLSNYIEN